GRRGAKRRRRKTAAVGAESDREPQTGALGLAEDDNGEASEAHDDALTDSGDGEGAGSESEPDDTAEAA
ncbi:MAG: hypothetical protein ACRDLV_13435, partial [Solirubrobacteraceae bacterium]